MTTNIQVNYNCDLCNKVLSDKNAVDIITPITDDLTEKSLHVRIHYRHVSGNIVMEDSANLCKLCSAKLLKNAARKVSQKDKTSRDGL